MNELVVTMGADQRLVGTLCMPTDVAPRSIAFVMLNAGVVSRIGPHRSTSNWLGIRQRWAFPVCALTCLDKVIAPTPPHWSRRHKKNK